MITGQLSTLCGYKVPGHTTYVVASKRDFHWLGRFLSCIAWSDCKPSFLSLATDEVDSPIPVVVNSVDSG